jgi:hypothetical protein
MSDVETTEDVPNVAEPDTTEADLRTWGLSGQPSTWALSTWTSLIDVIRGANRGAMDAAAVQDALDGVFPEAGYQAGNVMLAHPPVGEFTATVTDMSLRVDLAGDQDLGLPDENVQWDFGDGTLVNDAGGWDHTYAEPGVYAVRLYVMVGGARYGSGQEVTVGTVAEDAPLFGSGDVDPGVLGRDATVFESETDDLPNTSVSAEASEAQADAVADYIAGGSEESVEEDKPYDPGEHTVDEVIAYAEAHPDEVDDIIAAEEAGKGRVTLLDRLG